VLSRDECHGALIKAMEDHVLLCNLAGQTDNEQLNDIIASGFKNRIESERRLCEAKQKLYALMIEDTIKNRNEIWESTNGKRERSERLAQDISLRRSGEV